MGDNLHYSPYYNYVIADSNENLFFVTDFSNALK